MKESEFNELFKNSDNDWDNERGLVNFHLKEQSFKAFIKKYNYFQRSLYLPLFNTF